ncbi:E1-like protein-activating enzyme G [Thecamonas trahens ATCC 50062]|uniref:Ubiquitin-like modifier-activating enzyme ATG7 n=1 Tax=Thecamonas trahens ATCC 50062 TaxID=461836 RepID=A0A0L0DV91_THETB|nr:E1-like protein-activating enzyme G [Thecamonas trahens ATCC 50062]KNC56016.1 E1-like protein-activating enzyme G [Thecamonas trahens ATCC 50062]|eukprot:XP_013761060.1 E1-like protein-activating enzyme G [Thecamonas trahens ATCC 50062]
MAVQFYPLRLVVEASFWYALAAEKIDRLQLATEPVPVAARFSTGAKAPVDGRLFLSGDSLQDPLPPRPHHHHVHGALTLVNTAADFKALDKKSLFDAAAAQLWADIASGAWLDAPELLLPFLVLTYADLKKHIFRYQAAFPAIKLSPAVQSPAPASLLVLDDGGKALAAAVDAKFGTDSRPLVWLVRLSPGCEPAVEEVSEWAAFWAADPETAPLIAVADPVSSPDHPGWALRNVAAAVATTFGLSTFTLLAYRESLAAADADAPLASSLVVPVEVAPEALAAAAENRPSAVGWEKNKRGKIGSKVVDLGASMDPNQLMETSVDLNLKLMRWRLLPELDLDTIAGTRVLLLGAGTLGCNVARALMGWGVRTLTFVDSGKVSYSNPVRQSLFTFADAAAGEYKAPAAAAAIRAIFPGMNASGHVLSIPMPGHGASGDAQASVDKLVELYNEADAVFLLTDTRESRWLPTLLGAVMDKLVINTAMGFDTFVCMRHGPTDAASRAAGSRLGCYFCTDIVAPTDSLTQRSLDQACTVVRPGNSYLSSSLAVELLIALLHHPARHHAPADEPVAVGVPTEHRLGLIPHQIRGFMTHYAHKLVVAHAYDKCTACSSAVVDAYVAEGWAFVERVLTDPEVLEEVTGLAAMKAELEAGTSWDIDDFSDDGSAGASGAPGGGDRSDDSFELI